MEIEVTAFIYVLILVGDPDSDAYSYVCLTLSHYKTLFSVTVFLSFKHMTCLGLLYYLFIY